MMINFFNYTKKQLQAEKNNAVQIIQRYIFYVPGMQYFIT